MSALVQDLLSWLPSWWLSSWLGWGKRPSDADDPHTSLTAGRLKGLRWQRVAARVSMQHSIQRGSRAPSDATSMPKIQCGVSQPEPAEGAPKHAERPAIR